MVPIGALPELIAISGNGVAACCCSRLLQGIKPTTLLRGEGKLRVPALMLSDGTRMLLEDIFDDKTIFNGLHQIRQRIVAWGFRSEPVILPHSGIVVSESTLLERLWPKIHLDSAAEIIPTWNIRCAGGMSQDGIEYRFGSRVAFATEAQLVKGTPQDACWIESLRNGWLFLISSGAQSASLLAIGSSPEELFTESRLILKQVETLNAAGFRFPAYPRIHTPLSGANWIACGTAALGFDPICGEGVGNAVREAVLASAVLRAILRGSDAAAVLSHYSARLIGGFLRHIQSCASFYESGGSGPWWQSELKELQRGIEWTRTAVRNCPSPGYRLLGFDLQSIA